MSKSTSTSIFGQQLKQLRDKLDLTQQALGQRAGLSVAAIRKLESGERRPSKEVAEALAKALQVPTLERAAFVVTARSDPQNSVQVAAAKTALPPNNLPGLLPTLIGRDADVIDLASRVTGKSRLVTVLGPGGVGKTRLALQVAEQVLPAFVDGVWFIDLSPVRDPELVPVTLLRALGLAEDATQPQLQTLKQGLVNKSLLLVLDNFEQVTRAAPQVAELLSACRQVKALVTSRERTHIATEQTHALAPLSLADACALFVARAQHAKPDFKLNSANEPAVHELCQRLDGLPLAIELVAARMKLMTPQAILARIVTAHGHIRNDYVADGLSDLPARQHTLRDTIQWSYDLLKTDEQRAFRQLGIFVGGCTLEAAEAVIESPDPVAVWNALTSLLDKSLIQQREHDGEARFVMLETIREYARNILETSHESESTFQRYATHFHKIAWEAKGVLRAKDQAACAAQIDRDHDNLRSVLQIWLERGEYLNAAQAAGALQTFWYFKGYIKEGQQWLSKIWDVKPASFAREEERIAWSRVAGGLGMFADERGDFAQSLVWYEHALSLARDTKERFWLRSVLSYLCQAHTEVGNLDLAEAFGQDGLAIARELNDTRAIGVHVSDLGALARKRGNFQAAYDFFQESLQLSRKIDNPLDICSDLGNLANVAQAMGKLDEAADWVQQGVELANKLGHTPSLLYVKTIAATVALSRLDYPAAQHECRDVLVLNREIKGIHHDAAILECTAKIMQHNNRHESATQLLGAVSNAYSEMGRSWDESDRKGFDEYSATSRITLGDAIFEREFACGQALSLEEAVQFALIELSAT